jgi:hypothetical protein
MRLPVCPLSNLCFDISDCWLAGLFAADESPSKLSNSMDGMGRHHLYGDLCLTRSDRRTELKIKENS